MKEEVYVYKCPNCGGKVEYKNSKWHCSYCKNVYDSLFAYNNTTPLTDYKNDTIELFSFICHNCNEKYIGKSDNEPCPKCNTPSSKNGISFNVLNFLEESISINDISKKNQYNLVKYKKEDSRVFNNNFSLQYISCDLYNGIIKLSYGKHTLKYVLVGMLIPNTEYEDYNFMYELACYGHYNSQKIEKEKLVDKIVSNSNKLNIIESKDYRQDLVNGCINSFASKYKISDIDSIEVDESIEIDRGLYVPFYISSSEYNEKKYHQYFFGSKNAYLLKKDFYNKQTNDDSIVELSKDEIACTKVKKYKKTLNIIDGIIKTLPKLFFMMIASFVIVAFFNSITLLHYLLIFFYLFILSLIIGVFMKVTILNKYRINEKKMKLSKEEIFDLIMNNSESVKVIKVKK